MEGWLLLMVNDTSSGVHQASRIDLFASKIPGLTTHESTLKHSRYGSVLFLYSRPVRRWGYLLKTDIERLGTTLKEIR